VLIYETFARGNERIGRPRNPDFLLRPGELLAAVTRLTVVAFEQGEMSVARRAVFSGSPQWPAHSGGCRKLQATGRCLQKPISASVSRGNLLETIRELKTRVPVYSPVKPGSWIVPNTDPAGIADPVEALSLLDGCDACSV